MFEIIKIIFDKLGKQIPFVSFLTFTVISVLLVLPNKILTLYGLDILVVDYKKQLGIIALVSFILTLSFLFSYVFNYIKNFIAINEYKKQTLDCLNSLSREELDILKGAVRRNQRTIIGEFTNYILQSLCNKGLLNNKGVGDILHWPFIIPDFVFYELKKQERLQLNANNNN